VKGYRVQHGAEDDYHLVAFAPYTGLRRGDLLAFHWPDVDLEPRTATVNRSMAPMVCGVPILELPRFEGHMDARMRLPL